MPLGSRVTPFASTIASPLGGDESQVPDRKAEVKSMKKIIDAVLGPAHRTLLLRGGGVARLPAHYEALSTARDIRPKGKPPHATYIRTWHGEQILAVELSGTPVTSVRKQRHLDLHARWVALLVPFEGAVHFEQYGRRHELHPGEAGCLVSDWEHRLAMHSGSRLAVVYVCEESLRPAGLSFEELVSRKWTGGVLIPTMSVLLQGLLGRRATGHVPSVEETLLQVAINILVSNPVSHLDASGDERLRARLLEIIEARFHDPEVTVDALANELGVSRRNLYSLVGPQGMSVGAMLRARRVNRGARLMEMRPKLPLQQVAALCGFRGRDQFSRAFKASFHMTPTEFRSRVAEPDPNAPSHPKQDRGLSSEDLAAPVDRRTMDDDLS